MQRRCERTEAGEGNGNKTAKGSRHAGEQAYGKGEPHKDPEGEDMQENTVQGQSGRASKHATGLGTKKTPTTALPETRNEAPQSPCLPPTGATSTSPSTGKVATSCRTHSVWLVLWKDAAADTLVEDVVAEGGRWRASVRSETPASPGEATRAMPEARRDATRGRAHLCSGGHSCCRLLLMAADTMKGDAEGKQWGAIEHCAVGRLSLHASITHRGNMHPSSTSVRRNRHQSHAVHILSCRLLGETRNASRRGRHRKYHTKSTRACT